MKALKHLTNRFSFAWNNSKRLNVTAQDIEALNILIQEENSKKRNESLEDALILFYLLKVYKVHNENNKLVLKHKKPDEIGFPMGMPEASDILNRLAILLNPKHEVIKMIADELWLYQEYERMPKIKIYGCKIWTEFPVHDQKRSIFHITSIFQYQKTSE